VVIIGDLMLLLALFLSANMALAWGELGSFPVQGDKSALAGLGGAFPLAVWAHVAAWRQGYRRG